jgi:hypothetical protein
MDIYDQVALLTVLLSFEKYAFRTMSRCPAKVLGRNPSSGSRVKRRAVISREVEMKNLFMQRSRMRGAIEDETRLPSYLLSDDHVMLITSS